MIKFIFSRDTTPRSSSQLLQSAPKMNSKKAGHETPHRVQGKTPDIVPGDRRKKVGVDGVATEDGGYVMHSHAVDGGRYTIQDAVDGGQFTVQEALDHDLQRIDEVFRGAVVNSRLREFMELYVRTQAAAAAGEPEVKVMYVDDLSELIGDMQFMGNVIADAEAEKTSDRVG